MADRFPPRTANGLGGCASSALARANTSRYHGLRRHPLKDASGTIVGGIGISGLAAHEDHAISEAMASIVAAS